MPFGRNISISRVLMTDPRIDALPPVVQPVNLGFAPGGARHLGGRHSPPAGAYRHVRGQALPDIADADQHVQAGVRDEDDVGGRAGGQGGEGPGRAGREDVGHGSGSFGQVGEAFSAQARDAAAPAQRGPVGAFWEDDQRGQLVKAGG
jgi:hypothetical protein